MDIKENTKFRLELAKKTWSKVVVFIKATVRIPRGAPIWMKALLVFIYGLAFFLLFLLLIDLNFLWLFGSSPKISELKDPPMSITSHLYSADGQLLGDYFIENRTPVEFKDLPQSLVDALIATEDIRFYKHHGIDIIGTVAATYSTLKGDKRGGSTITQQLVKNLYKTRTDLSKGLFSYIPLISTIISKAKEWINAFKIEMYYSKEDIITMYFNTVDFGNKAFGINSAAYTYFNTTPSDLKLEQSAVLVGMLKAPSYYNPVQKPANALNRRNQVFMQMNRYDFISSRVKDSLTKLPLTLTFNKSGKRKEAETYFREAIARSIQNWCKENNYDIYTDGLKIYTTIDSRMQKYADDAVAQHMRQIQHAVDNGAAGVVFPWIDEKGKEVPGYFLKIAAETATYTKLMKQFGSNNDSILFYLNKPHKMKYFSYSGTRDTSMSVLDSIKYYKKIFQCGFIAMEPVTGFVKAWVGGVNYKFFNYDHVSQSKRQPGSTFKAFVYCAALDNGYGPCDEITDKVVSIKYQENGEEKVWQPQNVDRVHLGTMTLKRAFARSVNSVAVQLAEQIGWKKVIEYAKLLGIKSTLQEVPSICLGSSNVSLYELVDSYCPFVNDGYRVEPVLVSRIEDSDGKIIYEYKPKPTRVIRPENAFLMSMLLRGGLTEPGGTPQGLFSYDIFRFNTDFGGKTGTSSDYADGWFVGVTPGLVGGAWVGNDDMAIHFKSSHVGEGLRTALPIYGKFMEKVLKDESLNIYRQRFPKPAFKVSKEYNCQTQLPRADSTESSADSLAE